MPTLRRVEDGWLLDESLVKRAYNIDDIKQRGIQDYPGNPEYADYFLTTDDSRLRAKVCCVRYAPDNQAKWHIETLHSSDCAFYVLSGNGEVLLDKDRWVRVRSGDLIYFSARQPHGMRVTVPGEEVWYVSVEGPGPVTVGDMNGKWHSVVGNGPPRDRDH